MYKRIEGIIQLKTKKLPPAIDEKEAYGKDQVGSDSLGSSLGKGKYVKGLGYAFFVMNRPQLFGFWYGALDHQ